jgi:hypothetical protein
MGREKNLLVQEELMAISARNLTLMVMQQIVELA